MSGRRLTFAIFAASLLVLSPLAFQSKWPLVFYRFDGIFHPISPLCLSFLRKMLLCCSLPSLPDQSVSYS